MAQHVAQHEAQNEAQNETQHETQHEAQCGVCVGAGLVVEVGVNGAVRWE